MRRLLDAAHAPSVIQDADDVLALVVRAPVGPDASALPPEEWLDASAFQQTATHALAGAGPAACQAALALYSGDFLPDERTLDAEWEEPWLTRRRDALGALSLRLRRHLAGLAAAQGVLDAAEEQLRAVLEREPAD